MKTKRKFKKSFKTSAILVVACLLVVFCFGIKLINTSSDINKQEQKVKSLAQQCDEREAENAELREMLDSGEKDKYIEQRARENGYVMPNERVYVDISADE